MASGYQVSPNCTIEANEFSALLPAFDKLGVRVVGISPDSSERHAAFCQNHRLGVTLLSDPTGDLKRAAGIGDVEWKGRLYWARTTLLVGPGLVVRRVYEDVKAPGHAARVLADCEQLLATV